MLYNCSVILFWPVKLSASSSCLKAILKLSERPLIDIPGFNMSSVLSITSSVSFPSVFTISSGIVHCST